MPPPHSGWELRKFSAKNVPQLPQEMKAHKFAYKQMKRRQMKIAIHINWQRNAKAKAMENTEIIVGGTVRN